MLNSEDIGGEDCRSESPIILIFNFLRFFIFLLSGRFLHFVAIFYFLGGEC